MIKFSIVIITRQMNDYIREAMPYFLRQTCKDFEIVLVSEEKIEENFEKTRVIVTGRASPAKARNIGAKNSKGEIIAFIDDDAYPEANWLETANKNFKDKKIVALGGPSLIPKNATFFQRVSSKVYELSSGKTGDRYKQGKKKEIDDWPTCNFFVRRKKFLEVKGFQEKYWGGEDTQLCYSLLKKGKMIYEPDLIIYHHPRKTLKQHLRQTFFWGMWRGFFMRLYKKSRQMVFFAPGLLVVWLFIGMIISWLNNIFACIYLISVALYIIFLLYIGLKSKSIKLFFPVIFVTFLTHISYGMGFLKGISSKNEPIKKTLNPAGKIKINK